MKFNFSLLIKKIILLMTVFLLASFIVFDTNKYISLILLGVTIVILILDSIDNGYKVKIEFGVFHIWVFLFATFCLLSSLWAIDFQAALSKGITIIQIMICMSVLYNHYYRKDNFINLLIAIEYAGYLAAICTISFYGIEYIKNSFIVASRLDSEFANVNSIGMACAISLVICIYHALYKGNRSIIKLPLVAAALIVVAATASRKALFVIVFGSIYLYLFKYTSKNIIKTILKWLVVMICLISVFMAMLQFQIFSVLNQRMEGLIALLGGTGTIDHSTWLRQQYIKIGLEQFLETPFLGIGIDNARLLLMQHFGYTTYLHNNYVELLASGGIMGLTLFYSIYAYLLNKLKNKWRCYGSEAVIILLLILVQLAIDFGSVSYYSKITYSYLMICCIIVSKLKNIY